MTITRHSHRANLSNNPTYINRVLGFTPTGRPFRLPNDRGSNDSKVSSSLSSKPVSSPPLRSNDVNGLSPQKKETSISNRCSVVTPPKKVLVLGSKSPHLFNPSSSKSAASAPISLESGNSYSNEKCSKNLKIELSAFSQSIVWNETALLWKASQSAATNQEVLSSSLKQAEHDAALRVFELAREYWQTVKSLVSRPEGGERLNDSRARQFADPMNPLSMVNEVGQKSQATHKQGSFQFNNSLDAAVFKPTSATLVPESPISTSSSPLSSPSPPPSEEEDELEALLVLRTSENKALLQRNDELREALASVLAVATANNSSSSSSFSSSPPNTPSSPPTGGQQPQQEGAQPRLTEDDASDVPEGTFQSSQSKGGAYNAGVGAGLDGGAGCLGAGGADDDDLVMCLRAAHSKELLEVKRGAAKRVAAVKATYADYHNRCEEYCERMALGRMPASLQSLQSGGDGNGPQLLRCVFNAVVGEEVKPDMESLAAEDKTRKSLCSGSRIEANGFAGGVWGVKNWGVAVKTVTGTIFEGLAFVSLATTICLAIAALVSAMMGPSVFFLGDNSDELKGSKSSPALSGISRMAVENLEAHVAAFTQAAIAAAFFFVSKLTAVFW